MRIMGARKAVVRRPDTSATGTYQLETGALFTQRYRATQTFYKNFCLYAYCTEIFIFHNTSLPE